MVASIFSELEHKALSRRRGGRCEEQRQASGRHTAEREPPGEREEGPTPLSPQVWLASMVLRGQDFSRHLHTRGAGTRQEQME